MAHKSKFINTFSLLLMVVFMAALFAKSAYENRCHFVDCSPASWETIQEMAFGETGSDFRIEYISARPSKWNNYTEAGPDFIEIDVTYISVNTDKSNPQEEINYPIKHFTFNNRNLITRTRTGSSWSNRVPSSESQEKLKRVTVHPRDAFRLTWMLAEKDSSIPTINAHVSALLGFDNLAEKFGCESMWAVWYLYDHVKLTYYINAQTGQIISSEKTLY